MDERLKKFLAKPKTFTKGDWEITLEPFKGADLDVFMDMAEKPGTQEVLSVVQHALERSGYESTIDELKEQPLPFIQWVFESIMDVNGMDAESSKK
jgi:hypothetical protein